MEWWSGGVEENSPDRGTTMPLARSFRDLKVWQLSMDLAMEGFERSKRFPDIERYSLTDQIRRASRSVATNTSEAWRKRRYHDPRCRPLVRRVRDLMHFTPPLNHSITPSLVPPWPFSS